MTKYYSLLTLEHGSVSRWCPQFGDYDRSVVMAERDNYVESQGYRKKDTKIVCTDDTQASIDTYCKKLNESLVTTNA